MTPQRRIYIALLIAWLAGIAFAAGWIRLLLER